ncbi:MAG: DUF4198 domain-containing protein [Planctomycetes bacterium]|nr:DUF4198 domain-containing protein [Planctomycetota bacterium]
MKISPAAVLLALFASALPLSAHDHWLAPTHFRGAPGERLDLTLCVGHPSQYELQIRDPRRSVRFESVGPKGAKPVPGVDGKSPAGIFRPADAGLYWITYQSDHAFVEIAPEKYAQYLKDEGLEEVLHEREQRGENALPGRDSYARFDKALLCIGDVATDGFERALGLPIELVAETNPFTWERQQELVLRLELDGKPRAGQQVKLMRLAAPFTILLARTDERGRARFTPELGGGWVASTVHQRRATPEQKLEGDWEGLWASLSFELGASAPVVAH